MRVSFFFFSQLYFFLQFQIEKKSSDSPKSIKVSQYFSNLLRLFKPINATELVTSVYPVGSDIVHLQALNVTGISLYNENEKYFWYHHTQADTMSVMDSTALDLCTALWGGVAYILADLSIDLPRL